MIIVMARRGCEPRPLGSPCEPRLASTPFRINFTGARGVNGDSIQLSVNCRAALDLRRRRPPLEERLGRGHRLRLRPGRAAPEPVPRPRRDGRRPGARLRLQSGEPDPQPERKQRRLRLDGRGRGRPALFGQRPEPVYRRRLRGLRLRLERQPHLGRLDRLRLRRREPSGLGLRREECGFGLRPARPSVPGVGQRRQQPSAGLGGERPGPAYAQRRDRLPDGEVPAMFQSIFDIAAFSRNPGRIPADGFRLRYWSAS